jgi:hypothetical protein
MKDAFLRTILFGSLALSLFSCSLFLECDSIEDNREISGFHLKKQPWYGNNCYLDTILNSISYKSDIYDFDNTLYRIPVKFWFFVGDEFKEKPELVMKSFISELNSTFIENNCGIVFYMRPDYEFKYRRRYNKLGYYGEAPFQSFSNGDKECINIFIVNDLVKNIFRNKSINGTYNKVTKTVIVKWNSPRSSISHEIGHFLGLLHPHRNYNKNKCRQEAVSRSRKFDGCGNKGLICEQNGDALCDTPAEPNLAKLINSDCKYTGIGLKDNWGDLYQPDNNNIMSYIIRGSCRQMFTPGQVAVMHHTLKEVALQGWMANRNGANVNNSFQFDHYEPDNEKDNSTLLTFGSSQYHTFHQVFMGKDKNNAEDKSDWFKISIKTNTLSNVKIRVSKGSNTFPLFSIEMVDGYGRNCQYSKKDSNTNYTELIFNELNSGDYFINISNLSSFKINELFDYNISLKAE